MNFHRCIKAGADDAAPRQPGTFRRPASALRRMLPGLLLAGALGLGTGLAQAQTPQEPAPDAAPAVPDTRSLIDALRPPPPQARARNLIVRPVAPAPDASVPAGTSPAPDPAPPAEINLDIRFEINSARLRPESSQVLGHLLAALLSPELAQSRFLIEGHTDASGNAALNQRLSQRRADEVRQFLVTLGVAPQRLQALGLGSSQPLNPANPRAAENRRVRVALLP